MKGEEKLPNFNEVKEENQNISEKKSSAENNSEQSTNSTCSIPNKMQAMDDSWNKMRDKFHSVLTEQDDKYENIDPILRPRDKEEEDKESEEQRPWKEVYENWRQTCQREFPKEIKELWDEYKKVASADAEEFSSFCFRTFRKFNPNTQFSYFKFEYIGIMRRLITHVTPEAFVEVDLIMEQMQKLQETDNDPYCKYDKYCFTEEDSDVSGNLRDKFYKEGDFEWNSEENVPKNKIGDGDEKQGNKQHEAKEEEDEQQEDEQQEDEQQEDEQPEDEILPSLTPPPSPKSQPLKQADAKQGRKKKIGPSRDEEGIELDEKGNPKPFDLPHISAEKDELKTKGEQPKYTNAPNCSCQTMTSALIETNFQKFPFETHLQTLSNYLQTDERIRELKNIASSSNHAKKHEAKKHLKEFEKDVKRRRSLRSIALEIEEELHEQLGCYKLPEAAGTYHVSENQVDKTSYEILGQQLQHIPGHYPVLTGGDGNCAFRVCIYIKFLYRGVRKQQILK